MTDEEKKDYIQGLIYDLYDLQCVLLDRDKLEFAIMKALEKGLAEGRKETEAHLLENWCRNEDDYCPHLKELEKENKQLSDRLQEFSDCECCKSLYTKDKCRSCDDTLCNWEFEY